MRRVVSAVRRDARLRGRRRASLDVPPVAPARPTSPPSFARVAAVQARGRRAPPRAAPGRRPPPDTYRTARARVRDRAIDRGTGVRVRLETGTPRGRQETGA